MRWHRRGRSATTPQKAAEPSGSAHRLTERARTKKDSRVRGQKRCVGESRCLHQLTSFSPSVAAPRFVACRALLPSIRKGSSSFLAPSTPLEPHLRTRDGTNNVSTCPGPGAVGDHLEPPDLWVGDSDVRVDKTLSRVAFLQHGPWFHLLCPFSLHPTEAPSCMLNVHATEPRHTSGWSGTEWRNQKINSTKIRVELQLPQQGPQPSATELRVENSAALPEPRKEAGCLTG